MTTRLEVYGEIYGEIFRELFKIEKSGETLGDIDCTGLFTCDMDRVPIQWIKLSEKKCTLCEY